MFKIFPWKKKGLDYILQFENPTETPSLPK